MRRSHGRARKVSDPTRSCRVRPRRVAKACRTSVARSAGGSPAPSKAARRSSKKPRRPETPNVLTNDALATIALHLTQGSQRSCEDAEVLLAHFNRGGAWQEAARLLWGQGALHVKTRKDFMELCYKKRQGSMVAKYNTGGYVSEAEHRAFGKPEHVATNSWVVPGLVVRGYSDDGSSYVNYRLLKKGHKDKVVLESERDSHDRYNGTASISRSARGTGYHLRVPKWTGPQLGLASAGLDLP